MQDIATAAANLDEQLTSSELAPPALILSEPAQESEAAFFLPLSVIAVLHLSAYAALVNGWLPVAAYLIFFVVASVRLFILYHDRLHASRSPRWRLFGRIFDFYAIPCQPYQDLVPGSAARHLKHHAAHARFVDTNKITLADDPHIYFERGPWYRCLFASMFHDELMLYLDLHSGQRFWTKNRLIHVLACFAFFPAAALHWGVGAWLVPLVGVRLGQGLAYFYFSHVLHRPRFYAYTHNPSMAWPQRILRTTLRFIFGRRVAIASTHHRAHHLYPKVRNSLLVEVSFYLELIESEQQTRPQSKNLDGMKTNNFAELAQENHAA